MVAKLVWSKHSSGKPGEAREIQEVDSILSFVSHKPLGVHSKILLKKLESFETIIYELEEGLGALSIPLIKTRVSLLNTLNH